MLILGDKSTRDNSQAFRLHSANYAVSSPQKRKYCEVNSRFELSCYADVLRLFPIGRL
jgi:hypothetical protein